MKKYLPYLFVGIILAAATILMLTNEESDKRQLDERMSFRRKDKIPYGTFVAFESLRNLFPASRISVSADAPGNWDSLSNYEGGQALLIVSPVFYADDYEMKQLVRFAESGNDVFISSAIVSEEAKTIMNCGISYLNIYNIYAGIPIEQDTLVVSLSKPFVRTYNYMYPGKKFDAHFFRVDSSVTTVLGSAANGNANFIHLRAGRGNIYMHLAPMAFTNYFLLRERNMEYFEDLLSVIPRSARTVVWDEYYRQKRMAYNDPYENTRKGWLATLFGFPALKWALLTAIFTLLVYVLMEMRRKQRYIPVITRPRNDSLDFVKTIGRLYFDKGDHRNLCRKMSAYFLEHVRSRYKLNTGEMNEDFVKGLQYKSGADESNIRSIVYFIRDMEQAPAITDQQLAYFHRQLESFYSKS